MGVTYDCGALLAAEANRRDIWTFHKWAVREGKTPVIPAGVLAQAWRGGPQAQLSRFLKACWIEPLDEELARKVGHICGRTGTSDIVDVSVVAGALARNDMVVTSDPGDIDQIASALGGSLRIHPV